MDFEQQPENQNKRNISEQKRWEELYTKYSEYNHEKESIIAKKEKVGSEDLEKLNEIISTKEIDELKILSEKTYSNEDSNTRTFAEEIELKDIHEEKFHSEEGGIKDPGEDKEEREKELMKKSSFYLSDDNILKQVENMEDMDSDEG